MILRSKIPEKERLRYDGGMEAPQGETMQLLVDAYGQGETLSDLAKLFGVSRSTISRWLQKAGVAKRPIGRPRKEGE